MLDDNIYLEDVTAKMNLLALCYHLLSFIIINQLSLEFFLVLFITFVPFIFILV